MILNGTINMSNDIKKSLDSSNFLNFTKDYISLVKDLLSDIDYSLLKKVVSIIKDSSKKIILFLWLKMEDPHLQHQLLSMMWVLMFLRDPQKKIKLKYFSLNDNIPSV